MAVQRLRKVATEFTGDVGGGENHDAAAAELMAKSTRLVGCAAGRGVGQDHVQGMFGTTLDDLCEKWGFPYPNYIKIDVDGIEIPIIQGAHHVLRNPALKSVIVELGTNEEQEQAIGLMKEAGLSVQFSTTRNWGETCFVFRK